MKTLFTIACVAAMAAGPVAKAEQAGMADVCQELANMAEMMMTLRQRGTPMGTLLAATQRVEDSGPGGGGIMALSRDIIVEAYDEPHWSTPETKQRSIGDFRDKVHVECLKGVKAATHY